MDLGAQVFDLLADLVNLSHRWGGGGVGLGGDGGRDKPLGHSVDRLFVAAVSIGHFARLISRFSARVSLRGASKSGVASGGSSLSLSASPSSRRTTFAGMPDSQLRTAFARLLRRASVSSKRLATPCRRCSISATRSSASLN
jgi:hypothetical protein